MGEFWTRYFLKNGHRMSKRQIKTVTKLEEEILYCIISINHLENIIERHSKKIEKIKNGGTKRPESDSENKNDF